MVWKGAEIKETKENTFDGFALFLRNAEFMIVKNILATVCIPLFSLLRYKSLCMVQEIVTARPASMYKLSLNSLGWEEPVGNLPREHPL
jgi:hypothetical protein